MSAQEILEKVGLAKALIGALVVSLPIAYSAGILTAQRVSIPADHERRITAVEDWTAAHDSIVSHPVMERLGSVETRVGSLEGQGPQIQNMVFELWCDRFPDRCSATPRAARGSEK